MTDQPPPFRILIVNDSATARLALRRGIESAPDMMVVGEALDGLEAATRVEELRPHVVVMDVVMPKLDGYAATRRIMADTPVPIIIMSEKVGVGDQAIFQALAAGALYAVEPLPSPADGAYRVRCGALHALLRTMAGARPASIEAIAQQDQTGREPATATEVTGHIDAIGIAASAGGPQAVRCVLESLPVDAMPPVLLVQHLSAGFTDGFAGWLGSVTGHTIVLASENERARPGIVYLAPDSHHLAIGPTLRLHIPETPVGSFRPSANVLFSSMARLKERAVGVILTGMGEDGADGALEMARAGGRIAAQDESTSAVYGMPRVAVAKGATDTMLPLTSIADWIVAQCSKP